MISKAALVMTMRLLLFSSLVVFLIGMSDAFLTPTSKPRHKEQTSLMMKKAGATSVATAALVVAGLLSTNDVLAIQPPSPTVAGIEIVPSGGGGFGGLGVSPFGWGPFGGFGFGFGIRSSQEPGVTIRQQQQSQRPLDKEQEIERAKAELEATKEYQKQLGAHIQELTKEQQQQGN